MMKSIQDTYTMNNGMKIPCIGFGTYKTVKNNDCEIIKKAIEVGYRYFDTASLYKTEEALGQAIAESYIPREEFIVASKLWKEDMGYQNTKKALYDSLEKLRMDYIDIFLIHWPRVSNDYNEWKELNIETWKAMEELVKEGKVKSIGLSNFLPHHIEVILDNCEIKPVVNQLELHPGYMQYATIEYCKNHDIQVQAWSPLGRQRLNEHPLLIELSKKYKVSIAQICLRFLLQLDIVALPKASTVERMRENKSIFDFNIEKEDMYRLLTLPMYGWSGEFPDPEFATKNK